MIKSISTKAFGLGEGFNLSDFSKKLKRGKNKSSTSESISLSARRVNACKSRVFSTPDSISLLPPYSRILRFQSKFLQRITYSCNTFIFAVFCYQSNYIDYLRNLCHFWLIRQADKRINFKLKLIDLLNYAITGIFNFSASFKVSLLPLHFSPLFLQQVSTTGGKHYEN